MALFKRRSRHAVTDATALGRDVIALRLGEGAAGAVPSGAVVVIVDAGGRARRSLSVKTVDDGGEAVYCFHPGPYSADLVPFAAAPELGLRLSFVVDAADPRVAQQRFDLFLHSEAEVGEAAPLTLARFAAMLEGALQRELEQGNLDLPPCTSHDEWNLFRAGLNQLLYTRFGVTVEDCLPADLGERVDFAALLASRAAADLVLMAPAASTGHADGLAEGLAESPGPLPISPPSQAAADGDARALRRLFLELPALGSAVRLVDLPAGHPWFALQQRLLQRLDLAGIEVATMPALAWSAPDRRVDAAQQARRAAASADAVRALDEAWALLARLQLAGVAALAALFDDADRIACNLEGALALRRMTFVAALDFDARREPT